MDGTRKLTLMDQANWSDASLAAAGVAVRDIPLVSIGGGIGSFALVDMLRICGVPVDDIRVLSDLNVPYETFRRLAHASQIGDHDRLRSDSSSTIDNIWGFPGYALREALRARNPLRFLAPLANVLSEPVLSNFYTPRAIDVYRSIDREAERIDWGSMRVNARAVAVRKRAEGGYHVLAESRDDGPTETLTAYRTRFVHIAVGYPGLRLPCDSQAYLQMHDTDRLVHAYQPHEHVYEGVMGQPGVVLVRGTGIAASKVIQRLLDGNEGGGAETVVWHLSRLNMAPATRHRPWFRRPAKGVWSYQGFNFTKAAWGGQHRTYLQRMPREERASFVYAIGGTSTAPRRAWQTQLHRAEKAGKYRPIVGTLETMSQEADGAILTQLQLADGTQGSLRCDYIIDATGLESDIRRHELLDDLIEKTGASVNEMSRLDVSGSFEVQGTENEDGKLYASGSIVLGGPYAPVDSFLGLQYAALQIADDLSDQGFGRRIGTLRSLEQWLRWLIGRAP